MNYQKLIMFSLLSFCPARAELALTIVPIADLIGEPIQKIVKIPDSKKAYQHIPLCGAQMPFISCPRIHQLLFNEVVEILEQRGNELKIALPNLFYISPDKKTRHNSFWTHKDNLISFEQLKKKSANLAYIPPPIQFSKKQMHFDPSIITLAFPYQDKKTGLTFSAGTRFALYESTQEDAESDQYIVAVFDKKKLDFTPMPIAKHVCVRNEARNHTEQIQTFVNLIRSWTKIASGFIPYVWGGCSFAAVSSSSTINELPVAHAKNSQASMYALENYTHTPKPGFDCTNLIARATQICGIPYFYKNSTTVAHCLAPLTDKDKLQEGDLIWVPRHVMVVGSLEHNTLLEARHYGHGYGKVHEIPLSKVFKGIETYDQLTNAFLNKQAIYRMDNKGTVKDTFSEFKLLKLASVWD